MQEQQRGIVFHTNDFGDLVMCIHAPSAVNWIKTLTTNPEGWARFSVRKRTQPRGKVTHSFAQIDMFREHKTELEYK